MYLLIEPSKRGNGVNMPKMSNLIGEITKFLDRLRSEEELIKMNKRLEIQNISQMRQILQYFIRKRRMEQFTIEKELGRCDYEVSYQGDTFSDKNDIIWVFEKTCLETDLWKLSNQALFSDVLALLLETFGIEGIPLSITNINTIFKLNIDLGSLNSGAIFHISTLGTEGERVVFGEVEVECKVVLNQESPSLSYLIQPLTLPPLPMKKIQEIAEYYSLMKETVFEESDGEEEEDEVEEVEEETVFSFPRPNLPTTSKTIENNQEEPEEESSEDLEDIHTNKEETSGVPDPLSMIQGTFSFFSEIVSSAQMFVLIL